MDACYIPRRVHISAVFADRLPRGFLLLVARPATYSFADIRMVIRIARPTPFSPPPLTPVHDYYARARYIQKVLERTEELREASTR